MFPSPFGRGARGEGLSESKILCDWESLTRRCAPTSPGGRGRHGRYAAALTESISEPISAALGFTSQNLPT